MASRNKGTKKGKKEQFSGSSGSKLIQHKHCQICGKAQLLDDKDVCSDECQKTLDANIKRKKMWWLYLIILMAALVGFWVFMYVL